MADVRPPVTVSLRWDEGLRFTAQAGHFTETIDGEAQAGPSPMQALAVGLAGCMAVDVVSILRKGRHPLRALTATLAGRRADGQPARFVAITLHFVVTGSVPPEAVDRAAQLSRDKYCSVWHSMRDDIEFDITYEIVPD
jgi:putative redox protein